MNANDTIWFNSHTPQWLWLSNFFQAPFDMPGIGRVSSAEHAYQAMKSVLPRECDRILEAPTPQEARRLGKHVAHIVPHWSQIRIQVMSLVIGVKFAPGTDLARALIGTERRSLVHLSPWDLFWGSTPERSGSNMLGHILMNQREILHTYNDNPIDRHII